MKNWLEAKDEELVCYCLNVDKKTIVTSIQQRNDTLKKIQESTTACTGNRCKELNPSGKCCSVDIKILLELYAGKKSEESSSCSCCSE